MFASLLEWTTHHHHNTTLRCYCFTIINFEFMKWEGLRCLSFEIFSLSLVQKMILFNVLGSRFIKLLKFENHSIISFHSLCSLVNITCMAIYVIFLVKATVTQSRLLHYYTVISFHLFGTGFGKLLLRVD